MNEEELPVSNEFITFVKIQLNHEQKQQLNRFLNLHYLGDVHEQKQQLNRFLNLHYLGDVHCNEYDENFKLVPKYPEKETKEFDEAVWRINAVHEYQVKVVYDVNGKCKLELL